MKISLRLRVFFLALIALTLVGCIAVYIYVAKDSLPAGTAAEHRPSGPLSADLPAAGMQRLAVIGGAGEMKIEPSTDGEVHVQLELKQQEHSFLWLVHWLSGETALDIQGAGLKLDRQGDGLAVSLTYPSGQSHDDVDEKWTISLPSQLFLDAGMRVGELKISGMQGGIKSSLVAGETVIHAVSGSIQASVTYGRLHVISDTAKPGVMTIESKHGIAVLSWDGTYYGPRQEHGFMSNVHLVGNSVVQRGSGAENMDLSVSYGEADLRVGPMGDFKDYRDLFADD